MAEIVGLLASVAGVSTAGIQIAALLYGSIQQLKGMQDEIKGIAREVETLSSVFDEIGTALQFEQEDGQSTSKLRFSRRAITTISDLVQDTQELYEKIRKSISNLNTLKVVSTA